MKLSKEREHLVLENVNLVHFILNKYGITPMGFIDYEDLISIGNIGLIKAAITFDEKRDFLFSTYAGKCIYNEVKCYILKCAKSIKRLSLDDFNENSGNDDFNLAKVIPDPESNEFIDEICNKDAFLELFNIIINYLCGKQRLIVLYRLGGVRQEDVAKKVDFSRTYVSQLENSGLQKIRDVYNTNEIYDKSFSISVTDSLYVLSVNLEDSVFYDENFKKIIQNFSNAISVNFIEKQLSITVPAELYSFVIIGDIFKELKDYLDKIELEPTMQIMEFIKANKFVSFADIMENFPIVRSSTAKNVIYMAEQMNIIEYVKYGIYKVIK